MTPKSIRPESKQPVLLMTTAPPSTAPWILGRKLPPLGLAYVAAALEKNGYPVQVLDNYLIRKSIDEVKQLIANLKPVIVGITCGSATYQRCLETAQAAKEAYPACKVVVGGWHATYMPESLLIGHPEVDYVVIGEGEQAITKLASAITKNEDNQTACTIPGVACIKNGQMVQNPPEFITDLEKVPFPARHLLPMDQYVRRIEFLDVEPVDIISVTRGCPYNCAYCDVEKIWGTKCRIFSPQKIVDEVKHLVDKYGSKGVYFISDNFTIRKKETLEFCGIMKKEKMDVQWVCDTRADLLSREVLRNMRQAGCRTIWFGVESGSPRIIEKINKGITMEQTAKAFEMCRAEDIQVACSFMLGIPGETIEDMEASLRFAKKLNPDWCGFNIYICYPGSVFYKEVIDNHLYDRVEDYLYYVKTDQFDFDSLMQIQRRLLRSWNRSPRRIIRKMKREGVGSVIKKGASALFHGRL